MTCVVIGSGPSGSHAALTLLSRGKSVELWDIGREDVTPSHPSADFHGLKRVLPHPHQYFLGDRFEALLGPDSSELLKYPPARRFLVQPSDAEWPFAETSFRPFVSFARGGLAVGWGANVLSYDADDIRDWPITFEDLRPAYAKVCSRIAIAGVADGLSEFFPGLVPNQPPVPLTEHESDILSLSLRHSARLRKRCGITVARSRLAVVTATAEPTACRLCGRCLWGCPHGSLYNPSLTTLRECERYPNFRYVPGRFVLNLECRQNRVVAIRFRETTTGRYASAPCASVFLAAGALQSGAIFLRSLRADASLDATAISTEATQSVMDTAVVRIPYLELSRIGLPGLGRRLQYNSLIVAHRVPRGDQWPTHCHGQLLSLPPLLYHRLIESLPFGTRSSLKLFKSVRGAIGTVTYFFPDRPSAGNGLSLLPDAGSPSGDRVEIRYRDCAGKDGVIQRTIDDTTRALRMLNCVPSRPIRGSPGAGIHYAGTIPMGDGAKCCDRNGQSNLYGNLYICDGAAFPTLPSKSITFSLMAHAVRVADVAQI